jgi:aminopeptidase-like protein
MTATALSDTVPAAIGEELHAVARDLFPINRSITGPGVRETLARIARMLPIEVRSVPTGTKAFDWTVPKEWSCREAYIEDAAGVRIVDVRNHNLHLVGYSVPVQKRLSLAELAPHLHSLPNRPDWIPYRTSYYKENWGFCLTHRQLETLTEQTYTVRIDTTLEPGVLNYAEAVIRGATTDEVLISTHVCHPSLANDNLSGIAITALLGRALGSAPRRYTYRLLFAPGTIGTIVWLATSGNDLSRIKHGLVAALLGRPGPMTYKKTRAGDAPIDRVVRRVFAERGARDEVIDFEPWGYDERQFNSPGINLNVGRLTRAGEGGYPEYHSSGDDLALVTSQALEDSYKAFCAIIDVLEADRTYINLSPRGEPQLGKYGLYDSLGGAQSVESARLALLWTLNLSDGAHSLLDIAERSRLPFNTIALAASRLAAAKLLGPVTSGASG